MFGIAIKIIRLHFRLPVARWHLNRQNLSHYLWANISIAVQLVTTSSESVSTLGQWAELITLISSMFSTQFFTCLTMLTVASSHSPLCSAVRLVLLFKVQNTFVAGETHRGSSQLSLCFMLFLTVQMIQAWRNYLPTVEFFMFLSYACASAASAASAECIW